MKWLAVICSICFLCSCSSKENAIVGKWKEIGGTEIMEFFKDGTVTVVQEGKEGMTMGGTYKFVDKGRVRFEFGGLGALVGPFVVKVSISGGELTITEPDGKVSKYSRLISSSKPAASKPVASWQTEAAEFCRRAATTAETFRIKAGVFPAEDTANAGGPGGDGTLFENTTNPNCPILTPYGANTYTFTFTRDATSPTYKWAITGSTNAAGTRQKNFYIDQTDVLRAETEPTVPNNMSPPYGG